MKKISGKCLCGSVAFEIPTELRKVVYCHCSQCLKTHGHFSAYTEAADATVKWLEKSSLTWFESSKKASRGFCSNCGASLFYKLNGSDQICVAAGCLEQPTELTPACHIYIEDASDYYLIDDELPKFKSDINWI